MIINKKKYLKIFSILFILTAITFLVYLYTQKVEKDNYALAKEPIIINLLTSVSSKFTLGI